MIPLWLGGGNNPRFYLYKAVKVKEDYCGDFESCRICKKEKKD